MISPKSPELAWVKSYVSPSIIEAAPYQIDTPPAAIKLDQNESPWDLPYSIKELVCKRLMEKPWNRYPSAHADELAKAVAGHAGVKEDSVLLGPGSNYLLSLILTVLTKGFEKGSGSILKIAQPSFPHYESHCRYEGIPYSPWVLDDDLEYNLASLGDLPTGSMVVFASPNNPVGNHLSIKQFETLLIRYPETLFIADEAYYEYTAEPYTPLLAKFSNLLLVRTFSKTMAAAGVRLGYIIGSSIYLDLLRKLRTPFVMNHFSLACLDALLTSPEVKEHLKRITSHTVYERVRVRKALETLAKDLQFTIKSTEANFFLLRWGSQDHALNAYKHLLSEGILVRNVSKGVGLSGCLRVTLGTSQENDSFLNAIRKLSRYVSTRK